jgi:hypothetical protein
MPRQLTASARCSIGDLLKMTRSTAGGRRLLHVALLFQSCSWEADSAVQLAPHVFIPSTALMPGMAALMSAEALFTNRVYLRASDALQQKKRQGGGSGE